MKVLIVGGGGREHALAHAVRRSPLVREIHCAPGNAGIARIARCAAIEASNVAGLAEFASKTGIDLTIVGPEVPLTLGITAEFARRGLDIFGASREAALIESSKVFSKEFMTRHGIPTASCEIFGAAGEALTFLDGSRARYPLVIKADGLAAGKGVILCADRKSAIAAVQSMMEARVLGDAGDRILIEEHLDGVEVSYFALTDGTRILPLVTCQDYKRALDGDRGPNTGGMGACSPSIHLDPEMELRVRDRIVVPTISGLAAEGRAYRGVLYVGLMLTGDGPRVLEYNARFGDPEAQVLLPRVASDLVPLLAAAASGSLEGERIAWRPESAATVVLAAAGYPGAPLTGMSVQGTEEAEALEDVSVFHAGTTRGPGEGPIVSGGRVLSVTALGPSLESAVARAYEGVAKIHFEGMHYRTDIGRDAVVALRESARPLA